jgi:mono/diheme cytochrome c family protein
MRLAAAVLVAAGLAYAQDAQQRGRAEEQRACVPCHSLRLVDSQRLSAAAWGKELDKMQRWGAVISDRQALLDYLSQEYPDTKPVPHPDRSGDGRK